jgi:hypothetical protein
MLSTLVGLMTRYYFLLICCCMKFAVLFLWGAPSDERMGLQFALQWLNSPSCAESITIHYCLIWDFPNLEGKVHIFISPRSRVVQLYPRALGSLYVILRLAGLWWRCKSSSLCGWRLSICDRMKGGLCFEKSQVWPKFHVGLVWTLEY